MKPEPKKILIINPFGLGDVIFSLILATSARQAYPKAQFYFLGNERTAGLVRMSRIISGVFIFNRDYFRGLFRKNIFSFLKEFRSFLKSIQEERFDIVFDLSLGREYGFFCWWVGIQRRVGLSYKRRGVFLTDKIEITGYENRPVAEIQRDLLKLLGVSVGREAPVIAWEWPRSAQETADELLRRQGIGAEDRVMVVAPGGGRSWGPKADFKQWNPEKFAKTADDMVSRHGLKVLLIGDPAERRLLENVRSHMSACALSVCDQPLSVVAALLKRAHVFLGNDGGLSHLANALGIKTVTLFGPVDESVYGPYYKRFGVSLVSNPVQCRPCYQKFCFPGCPHQRLCLEGLSVERVVQALNAWIIG